MKCRNVFLLAVMATGLASGANIITVPSVNQFPGKEASLADANLWKGYTLPLTADNSVYLYVGDTFRYFMDGGDATLTNSVRMGSVSFSDRSWVSPGTAQHLTLDLCNGAKLTTSSFTISRSIDGTYGSDATTHKLIVRDGATFEATGQFSISYGDAAVDILSGATLVTTNGQIGVGVTALTHPITWYEEPKERTVDTRLDLRFRLHDATWKARGFLFGPGSGANSENLRISLGVTNAVIESAGALGRFNAPGNYSLKGSTLTMDSALCLDSDAQVVFDDVTVPADANRANSLHVGGGVTSTRHQASVTLKGSTVFNAGAIVTAESAGYTGTVVVAENASFLLNPPSAWYEYVRPSLSGAGFFEIRDSGVFSLVTPKFFMPFRLGINAGAYGQLDVKGGLFDFIGYGVWIGVSGSGAVNVSGGELRTSRIYIGYSANATETSSFRQTGGRVILRGNDDAIDDWQGLLLVGYGAHRSSVSLEGGVLECSHINSQNSSYASVVADGGTVRFAGVWTGSHADAYFIRDIGSFTVGAKGLTIDSNGADLTVKQTMSSVSGKKGVLRKIGEGQLKAENSTWDLSSVVVSQGSLLLGADFAFGGDASLTVTNGTVFSLVGAATVASVNDFVLTNATLAVDPYDRIVVSGRAAIDNLKITFSTLPTLDEESEFLICPGTLDAGTQQALSRATFTNPLADGTHGELISTYDSGTGKTTVKIAVKTNTPLADETVWTGSGAWATAANWSAGVPTASKTAVFSSDSTSTSVTLGSGAVAGALRFSDRNFTLTGSSALSMPTAEGSLQLNVLSGTQMIGVPLSQESTFFVDVAAGATNTCAKAISGRGFVKTGKGKATFSGDNTFFGNVRVAGGMTSVTRASALGIVSSSYDNVVELSDGTLEIASGSGELSLGHDFVVSTSAATVPTLVKNERDTTLTRGLRVTQGCFIKRGVGRLTIPLRDGDDLTMTTSGTNEGDSSHVDYPEDGTPPTKLYGGITVSEGELLFKPAESGTHPTVTMKRPVWVGVKTSVPSGVNPVVALQDVTVRSIGTNWRVSQGCNSTADHETMCPGLRLVDSTLSFGYLYVGTWSYNKASRPWVAITNSTLDANGNLGVTVSNGAHAPTTFTAKDSTLLTGNGNGVYFNGGIRMDLDNCTVLRQNGTAPSWWCNAYAGNCTMNFRNGSVIGIGSLDFDDYGTNPEASYKYGDFNFEDSTWFIGENSLTLDSSTVYPGRLRFHTYGETGLTVDIATGCTLYFLNEPLSGAGGLTVTGGGTVKFANGMYLAQGKIAAAEGVLDFSDVDASYLQNVVIGPGAGTIKGGKFINATIALDEQGGAVPNFEDCSFSGTTSVRIGGTLAKADNVRIATYTGSFGDIRTFKFVKTDEFRGENFKAEDGEVTVQIVGKRGLMVIIRH